MLGGVEITTKARAHAKDMLAAAGQDGGKGSEAPAETSDTVRVRVRPKR